VFHKYLRRSPPLKKLPFPNRRTAVSEAKRPLHKTISLGCFNGYEFSGWIKRKSTGVVACQKPTALFLSLYYTSYPL
jgi:hypothetical protein